MYLISLYPIGVLFFTSSAIATNGDLLVAYFKVRPCVQGDTESFTQPQSIEHVPSWNSLTCALACCKNDDCVHAMFVAAEKVCRKSYQLLTPNTENPDDFGDYYDEKEQFDPNKYCLVLTKRDLEPQPTHFTPLQTSTAKFDHGNQIWNNFPFVPTFLITWEVAADNVTSFQISRISQVTIREKAGIVLTTKPRIFTVDTSAGIVSYPPTQEIQIATASEDGRNSVDIYDVALTGRKIEARNHSYGVMEFKEDYYVDKTGQLTGIVFADSVESVTSALLNGYRRVETQSTRSVIDTYDSDVYLDTTEVLIPVFQDDNESKAPALYVNSFKESVKNGKRYIFRNKLNNGSPLPFQEQSSSSWAFETNWEQLSLKDPLDSSGRELKSVALRGIEIRVVLDKTISTDVVAVRITSTDVIFHLPQYLFPLKAQDINATHPRVRFPVMSTSKKLLECEMIFQDTTVSQNITTMYSEADWFVTKDMWKSVYVVKLRDDPVGDFQELKLSMIDGLSIRVCVRLTPNEYCCHGADSIHVTSDDKIILQSPSFLTTDQASDKTLGIIDKDCHRRMMVVSTDGKVQITDYAVGKKAIANWKVIPFISQEWFVNYSDMKSHE